ncbi:MAG: hypothetical protein AAFN00_12525 [Cyanobacteria bacterium J06558_2]
MTLSNTPISKTRSSIWKLDEKDLPYALGGSLGAVYLAVTDLPLLITILFSAVVVSSTFFIIRCLPAVSKTFKTRISVWHALSLFMALTITLSAWQPSHALFLTGLEDAFKTLVTSGGVGSVSAAQITTLFTFIRIALVLVALGGGFAAVARQQGQSMTPIIMFVGGLFGIVIAIDIMTAVIATGT